MNPEHHRERWLLPVLSTVCLALGVTFAKLGSEVAEGELAGIDAAVRGFVQGHQTAFGSEFFTAITTLGSKPVLVALGILVGWLISERSVTLVLLIALCGWLSAELVHVLKEGFAVARPPATVIPSRSLAFPSGHVAGAAAVATLLSYVSWRRRKAMRYVIPVAAMIVALMAMSRVYLDRHWTSDTLGGGLIGMALGFACAALYEWTTLRHLQT